MKTKTVIHIVDGKIVRQEVPNDWIQCSVLGEFRPPEEFRKENEERQSRTNCTRAYNMPMEEWAHHKAIWEKLQPEIARQRQLYQRELFESEAGVSVDEMIEMLVALKESNPKARVVVDLEYKCSSPEIVRVQNYKNIYAIV